MQHDMEAPPHSEEVRLNAAVVGDDGGCRTFIEFIRGLSIPGLALHLAGVCCSDPEADGLSLARELGIFTTLDFQDILAIKDLHGVLALTDECAQELSRSKPEGVWVLEPSASRLFVSLLDLMRNLDTKGEEIAVEKMVSEFLFQQANERIVVLTPDFRILKASEGYLTAVNKPKENVIGKHCYEITHGLSSPCSEFVPDMGCPLQETLRTGKSAHVIHEHLMDGEHPTYCDLDTYPVKTSESGEIIRVIEIWRDITQELSSRWEMRLSQLKTDMGKLVQEDRLISLGKLSASCVHEINNPIQGLLTFSHLMQSMLNAGRTTPQDLKEFRHYLDLMSAELERCGKIISGLLSFAREATMETRDVALKDVIGAVISLTRHRMQLQDIEPVVEMPDETLTVRGDVNQLQQCFLNLLFNAVEAMPSGGTLRISVRADHKAGEVLVSVRDSGCGIPEEHLDKVFDPFFTTKGEGKGTGLGLSIVYGIVKNHDGRIEVESRGGEGTAFILHFPLKNAGAGGSDG